MGSLALVMASPAWMERAECRGVPTTSVFFTTQITATARILCGRCPVRDECLSYALSDPTLAGCWAGTSERERRRMRQGKAA